MKSIYTLGVMLLIPTRIFAHDGEHVTYVWQQDPFIIVSVLAVVASLSVLAYGLLRKRTVFIVAPALVLTIAVLAGFSTFTQNSTSEPEQLAVANFGAGQTVTLYKSPNCGCCSGHAKALEEAGFIVTIEETDNLDAIKQAQNIPADGASCHTSVIGDYVVEGHVPLEAIETLLAEKPDIAGIGLAGMPIGTPGMPGKKRAPYEVYQLSEAGEMSPYQTI